MIFLWKKKKVQENKYKSYRATVINKNNNIQKNRYNPNYSNNLNNINSKEKQTEETIPLNEDEEQEIKANEE